MRAILSEDEVLRIRAHVVRLQAEIDQLRAENAAMRAAARELIWCARCGALCPRIDRWRKYCSDECRRAAYNVIRRARYSQARDMGIPGRQVRVAVRELTWCARCGALCPASNRQRKYCGKKCKQAAWSTARRRTRRRQEGARMEG